MQRFHNGRHRRIECGETHVEHDEYHQKRNHARIGEHIAFLAIVIRLQLRDGQFVLLFVLLHGICAAIISSIAVNRQSHVRIVGRCRNNSDFTYYRRLRVTQCEEHRAADRARNRRHKQLRNGMHGSRQERGQNRSENEYDLIDGGFQCIRSVQQ